MKLYVGASHEQFTGQIRFGPDIEWLDPSQDWNTQLQPTTTRHHDVFEAVASYLPGVEQDGFVPDCERPPIR